MIGPLLYLPRRLLGALDAIQAMTSDIRAMAGSVSTLPEIRSHLAAIDTGVDLLSMEVLRMRRDVDLIQEEIVGVRRSVEPLSEELDGIRSSVQPLDAELERVRDSIGRLEAPLDGVRDSMVPLERAAVRIGHFGRLPGARRREGG